MWNRIFFIFFKILQTKCLNSNKTRFPFDKILDISPIVEVYGESNERQVC